MYIYYIYSMLIIIYKFTKATLDLRFFVKRHRVLTPNHKYIIIIIQKIYYYLNGRIYFIYLQCILGAGLYAYTRQTYYHVKNIFLKAF